MSIYRNDVQHHEQVQVVARDHREAARPAVRDQRKPAPKIVVRDRRTADRDRDRDRARPVIVVKQPVPIYTTGWSGGSYTTGGYTYQPQPVSLVGATALLQRLDMDTAGKLAGTSVIDICSTGSGSTLIEEITISYASGAHQVIRPNVVLSPQSSEYKLPLGDGSDVVRISVEGHSDWGGSIAVTAR